MRFNTNSVLLAALAAGAAATPYPGGSNCKRNCSPGQIYDSFNAPSYLSDTKDFCRKFMHLPATIWVTKTQTSYVTNYHTYTKTKTKTAYPVTVTDTDVETISLTDQETSFTTEIDVTTIIETYTVSLTVTNDVTETDHTTATEQVTAYTTITDIEVSTETDTVTATYTVTKVQPKPYYYQPYNRQKRDDIHIFKRGDYEYSSAYKIPSYLPQDLSPEQIGNACKKINPCTTRTSIVYTTVTVPSYKTKTVVSVTTVTPTVSTTITVYQTDVETVTIPETVTSTETETDITTIDVVAATVTEIIATEVETVATVTEVVETDTITNTVENTVTTISTAAVTVTTIVICNKGPAPCDLKHPERCCSGRCAKILKTPNCCVLKGEPCDLYHPEGCCSGKCKVKSYSYGKPVYACF